MRLSLLVALVVCAQSTVGRSFVNVRSDEEVCFVEQLTQGERLRGSWQVTAGGYNDIDVVVMHAETKEKVFEKFRAEDGVFDFLAKRAGDHKICFGNQMASNANKQILLAIHAGDSDDLLEHEAANLAEVGHVERLQSFVDRLGRRVADLYEQEEYLRRRSERHHRTAESNGHRVLLSSICEAIVLLAVNLAQVHFLRQFFEVKRII